MTGPKRVSAGIGLSKDSIYTGRYRKTHLPVDCFAHALLVLYPPRSASKRAGVSAVHANFCDMEKVYTVPGSCRARQIRDPRWLTSGRTPNWLRAQANDLACATTTASARHRPRLRCVTHFCNKVETLRLVCADKRSACKSSVRIFGRPLPRIRRPARHAQRCPHER
jgi:hypothetical protein